MIKSTKNQMGNAKNPYQGSQKKILTVCSAGLLRSATLQNYLIKNFDYNVRNCGTEESFALIPLSEVLLHWADWIVFVNKENYFEANLESDSMIGKTIIVLDIPDYYGFNDSKLLNIIENQWKWVKENVKNVDLDKMNYFEYDITNLKLD